LNYYKEQASMLEKQFNSDLLYNKVVHFYIDKKGYSKEQANSIAQLIVQKESQRRICKNEKCKHFSHDHIRNSETCLAINCECSKFTK
jgi:hypothetical protein